jgi:hypothetical protein
MAKITEDVLHQDALAELLLAMLNSWQQSVLTILPLTFDLAGGIRALDDHIFVLYLALLEANG